MSKELRELVAEMSRAQQSDALGEFDTNDWVERAEAALQAEPVDNETLSVEQEPMALTVLYGGEHCGNTYSGSAHGKALAQKQMEKLNEKYPEYGFEVVALYTHPATSEVSGYPKPFERLSEEWVLNFSRENTSLMDSEALYVANAIQDAIAEKNK